MMQKKLQLINQQLPFKLRNFMHQQCYTWRHKIAIIDLTATKMSLDNNHPVLSLLFELSAYITCSVEAVFGIS